MKAFLSGCAAAVLIAVVAGFALTMIDHSAATVYSTDNVRPPSSD